MAYNIVLGLLLSFSVGALIGFITNVVAVKLLFYPEKPWKIGPFKIQGLIPSRKQELALRVFNAVTSYITKEDIESLISDSLNREIFKAMLKDRIVKTLDSLPILKVLIGFQSLDSLANSITEVLMSIVMKYVDSIRHGVAHIISNNINLEKFIERKVNEVSSKDVESMFKKIAGKELRFIEFSGLLLGGIVGLIQGIIQSLIL